TPTLVLIEAVILATYSPLAQHNRSRRPPLSALTTQPAACLLVFIAFPALRIPNASSVVATGSLPTTAATWACIVIQ
ncbi:hypothetical protein CGCVW01_v000300, partial [Colletotrichum viniferum]